MTQIGLDHLVVSSYAINQVFKCHYTYDTDHTDGDRLVFDVFNYQNETVFNVNQIVELYLINNFAII